MTGFELKRLDGATRFMELRCWPSRGRRQRALWWVTVNKGSTRELIADVQKRITRVQKLLGLPPYNTTAFESRGGLHAHIVFVGNAETAKRLQRSAAFGTSIVVEPVTDAEALVTEYLAKERTPQAGYRRSHLLGGRIGGSHRLDGGGDRVRLSRELERDAVEAGYVEPWQHTNAKRYRGSPERMTPRTLQGNDLQLPTVGTIQTLLRKGIGPADRTGQEALLSNELLKRVGQFLFGEQWQSPLARDVGVGERSMRRWAAGTDPIPRGVWSDVGLRLESVQGDLEYLISEVRQASGLIEVHSFRVYDSRAGDMVRPSAKSTAERIARIGGDIILGTAEWVAPSSVDAEGRLRHDRAATTGLLPEDYELLEELSRRGGRAQILGGRPRDGAERLVAAGYAIVRTLNLSDLEYELTPLGRTARVLKMHGINNTIFSAIEPHRFDVDGRWWLKVSPEGAPPIMMEVGYATKLAILLRAAGANELADRFETETEKVRRCAMSGELRVHGEAS